jgi:hypothetical protein
VFTDGAVAAISPADGRLFSEIETSVDVERRPGTVIYGETRIRFWYFHSPMAMRSLAPKAAPASRPHPPRPARSAEQYSNGGRFLCLRIN